MSEVVVLTFQSGDTYFAVPLDEVREIASAARIQQIPRPEGSLSGLMDLRGVTIPVYHSGPLLEPEGLRGATADCELLSTAGARLAMERVIICSTTDGTEFGFQVEQLGGVGLARESKASPEPEKISATGVVQSPSKPVIMISITDLIERIRKRSYET